ncbi:hypothetical protein [Peribacillus muralis]
MQSGMERKAATLLREMRFWGDTAGAKRRGGSPTARGMGAPEVQ